MLFNSYIFILLFLPLSLAGYFILNKFHKYNAANIFLIAMSLWFYGYYNPKYLLVISCSIVINYGIAYILNNNESTNLRKIMLALGITGNAASIFYFKYFDFFLTNINHVFHKSFELRYIVLPLGISFFTFQQISYLVDTYRGQTKDYGFIEYALFVVYFPQLIAGPIVLHKETIPQFRNEENRKLNYDNVAKGIYIFSIGLFKKVMIADTFGKAVAWGFGNLETITSADAILVSLCYTFQLYFDFSGYCDMAIGIGNMFNIKLPQNFNSPYKATSIVDFWARWHMSLTRFLREYVYFPLGGSKKGTLRTYLNIMIVFLVSGIWHGANWTFILWGVLHGVLNCLTRACDRLWKKLNVVTQWFLTFCTIDVLWVIFRAASFREAKYFIKKMVSLSNLSVSNALANCFKLSEFALLEEICKPVKYCISHVTNLWLWIFIGVAFFIVLNLKNSYEMKFKATISQGITAVILMLWSVMSLAGVSEFLYFGF